MSKSAIKSNNEEKWLAQDITKIGAFDELSIRMIMGVFSEDTIDAYAKLPELNEHGLEEYGA